MSSLREVIYYQKRVLRSFIHAIRKLDEAETEMERRDSTILSWRQGYWEGTKAGIRIGLNPADYEFWKLIQTIDDIESQVANLILTQPIKD